MTTKQRGAGGSSVAAARSLSAVRSQGGQGPAGSVVLVRWAGELLMADLLPATFRQAQTLARVHHSARAAVARVAGITVVSQAAMLEALNVSMMKRKACMLVPEDAAKFDLIATQAVIGMAMQVSWISG
jgi:hypothetical protein